MRGRAHRRQSAGVAGNSASWRRDSVALCGFMLQFLANEEPPMARTPPLRVSRSELRTCEIRRGARTNCEVRAKGGVTRHASGTTGTESRQGRTYQPPVQDVAKARPSRVSCYTVRRSRRLSLHSRQNVARDRLAVVFRPRLPAVLHNRPLAPQPVEVPFPRTQPADV
jgi:hypothetical protein